MKKATNFINLKSRENTNMNHNFQVPLLIIIILLTSTKIEGQKLEVQDLKIGQGYILIRGEEIKIIENYSKILHVINLTLWTDNLELIQHNVDKLDDKNEYPNIIHGLNQLTREIESLTEKNRKKRALLNIVGKGLKYLTGTMDYEDEQEIKTRLSLNEENNKNVIDGLNEQVKINTKFYENIYNVTKHINKQQTEIKKQFSTINNEIDRENFKITSMQHAFQIQYDIQLLSDQVKKVKESILLSQLGLLGKDILSPNEIDKFNITLEKLKDIKSTTILHENQIIFIIMIPNYVNNKFHRVYIEPIPNLNYLELSTMYKSIITDGKTNYVDKNKILKKDDLIVINNECILNIFKKNTTCNFVKNANTEIKQLTNNIVILKNINKTEIEHNCNDFKLEISGNYAIKFENCIIKINNVKYENFMYYENFIIPNLSNVKIKNIELNFSTKEIHANHIKNRKI